MVLMIIFFIVIISILIIFSLQANRIEKQKFNNGICPKCGKPLVPIDTPTMYEDRGYECLNCYYITWVSCGSLVDRDFRKRNIR